MVTEGTSFTLLERHENSLQAGEDRLGTYHVHVVSVAQPHQLGWHPIQLVVARIGQDKTRELMSLHVSPLSSSLTGGHPSGNRSPCYQCSLQQTVPGLPHGVNSQDRQHFRQKRNNCLAMECWPL